jgi:hypothetical protein
MTGTLLRLFLTDGKPDGIKTIEIANMIILGIMFSRQDLKSLSMMDEVNTPGVYLLYGKNLENGMDLYIGEGDPVIKRLQNHYANSDMDFWTHGIIFISKDSYLTKTQIKFLESQLICDAKKAAKWTLINKNVPSEPNISKADRSEMIHFYELIHLILESFGFDFLRIPDDNNTNILQGIFEFVSKHVNAKMRVIEHVDRTDDEPMFDKFIILKGSIIRKGLPNERVKVYGDERNRLIKKNLLVPIDDNSFELMEDFVCVNVGGAALFVSGGRNGNGYDYWKCNGKTFREFEDEMYGDEEYDDEEYDDIAE